METLPIISRERDWVGLIHESLFSLFAIQQEESCERPFVETCRLLLEMILEENEAELSVSRWRAASSPVDRDWRKSLWAPLPRPFPLTATGADAGMMHVCVPLAGEQKPLSFRIFGRRTDCPLDSWLPMWWPQ